MKILSLFDGMACGYIAAKELGMDIEKYVAYEIDKHAVQTSKHNFPNIEHKGDVFEADFTEYEGFDYLVGGSPCTFWSVAQSPDKRETTASGMGWDLFSQYVRALHEAKPKYFIYENNKSMAPEIRKSISDTFGFEPVEINSALVSAQNRERLYWVGMRMDDGKYIGVQVDQPTDLHIYLKDVLDSTVESINGAACVASRGRNPENPSDRTSGTYLEQRYEARVDGKTNTLTTVQKDNYAAISISPLSENEMDYMVRDHADRRWNFMVKPDEKDKAGAIVANISKGIPYNVCAERISECYDTPKQVGAMPRPNGELSTSQAFRIYADNAKSVTLSANGGGAGGKTGLYAIPKSDSIEVPVCMRYTRSEEAKKCRKQYESHIIQHGYHEFSELHPREDGKTNTLSTVSKDNQICEVSSDENNSFPTYLVKNGMITVKGKQYPIKLKDGIYIIRKLSVTECMRLQTVPEWYEFPVSNTQALKMLGNGWTISVIMHLLKATIAGIPNEFNRVRKVRKLF